MLENIIKHIQPRTPVGTLRCPKELEIELESWRQDYLLFT